MRYSTMHPVMQGEGGATTPWGKAGVNVDMGMDFTRKKPGVKEGALSHRCSYKDINAYSIDVLIMPSISQAPLVFLRLPLPFHSFIPSR